MQLRDANTSAFLAEGTPEELAMAAELIGPEHVIFDDVGYDFNPRAVIKAYEERLVGLRGAAQEARDDDSHANFQRLITEAENAQARAHEIAQSVRLSA